MVSELLLSPKERWRKMKWKLYADVQCPKKWASSWEEGLSSLMKGKLAVAESHRKMTQDQVQIVCRGATPWKGIFLRGRVIFTRGWVNCCWVSKRDGAEKEKNNYKTDEGNRKGKYKHFVLCNVMYKKVILW